MSERAIFIAALQKADPTQRQAYLDEACAQQPELRKQVENLLRLHAGAGSFLEKPAAASAVTGVFPDAAARAASAEAPGALLGPYKLLEQIGEGGMGTVWMAQQTEPVKRLVALKLVKAGMDSKQVLARFEAERQALALMDHANIAHVLDAGTTDAGRPYFVMDLVKGVPITRYCDEHHLTPRQRLELFLPVCQAVQHAHQKGIIHRDLKPSNVLVALYDGKPVPKIIDFGVAKAAGHRLTEETLHTTFGAVVGTVEYMSPEQASLNQLDVDTRSDIYSLGVLLYELLTGSPPFRRKELEQAGLLETLRVIREREPTKPSAKLSTADGLPTLAAHRGTEPRRLTALVRGELDWIVMKALEKDRDRRYETANGFAKDVQRYLADEPVVAGPPSARYRLRKFIRRNRTPVLAASIILLLLIGGIVGTTVGLMEARRQRDAADLARLDEAREKDRAVAAEKLASNRLVQVENEKRRADEERAITQATNDFLLKDLLGQADSGNQPFGVGLPERNPKITVRQLLDRAQQAVVGKFAGQPLVEAAVRQTLAETYLGLGEYLLVIPHAERALALRRAHLAADHPDTLVSQTSLARAYSRTGKTKEAIALLEQVRDTRLKRLGPDHRDTVGTLHDLAVVHSGAGRMAQAIELFEKVREVQVRKLGPDHTDTLNTLSNLGSLYRRRRVGRAAEAAVLLEQVRDAQVKQHGPDHPRTLRTLNNLAGAYLAAGRTADAVDLYERVRDARVKALEPDHPDTLYTMSDLADAYRAAGRLGEAIRLYEHVAEVQQRRLPPGHIETLGTLHDLAAAYQAAGRSQEVVRPYEQLRDIFEKKYGPEHPHTLSTRNKLAEVYAAAGKLEQTLPLFQQAAASTEKGRFQHPEAGRIVGNLSDCHERLKQYEQAEVWRRKWLAVVKEKAGAESVAYTAELASLGWNLEQQQKWGEAEIVLRACLPIQLRREADAWTTFHTESLLGGALLAQQKYADAEPLLRQGYQGMKERQSRIPRESQARLTEALERLVRLYDQWGKPDEAAKWRKELEKTKEKP
jgi:eukaryotic-like serine/threonine-protein kinase